MLRHGGLVLFAFALSGCFLDRGGAVGSNDAAVPLVDASSIDAASGDAAPPRNDAAVDGAVDRVDAGPADAGMETFDTGLPDSGADSGPPPVDAGPSCTSADVGCVGDVALNCGLTGVMRTNCAATGDVCVVMGGAAICEAPPGCAIGVDQTVPVGRTQIDLCGGGANHTFHRTPDGCPDGLDAETGEDRLVELTITNRGTYRFDVNDRMGGNMVDPLVYVRTQCDDATTQLGCDDDRDMMNRNARLEVMLEPGTYYVVVDSLFYAGCGSVDLNITRR